MKTKKQWFFLILKIVIVLIILLIGGIYFFRDTLLHQALDKLKNKFKSEYNADFSVSDAKFIGTTSIELKNIHLVPLEADTILSVKNIKTEVSLMQLITGQIQLQNLEMQNGFIQLVKNEKGRNFDAFLKKDSNEETSDEKRNYSKLANRILTKVLNLVPAEMNLQNLS